MKAAVKSAEDWAKELSCQWDTLSWRECIPVFTQYLREHADGDYIHPDRSRIAGSFVWAKGVHWIEVSAVPGSNEGYYVHFRQVRADNDTTLCAIGKFWTLDAAEECVTFFHRFFYGNIR